MANFIKYNAHTKLENVSDCVKRALSLAYNKSYKETSKELIDIMHKLKEKSWGSYKVYTKFMRNNGLLGKVKKATNLTVNEFCEEYPKGTYILTTHAGQTNFSHSHMTCIIDGTIYDTWDCSNQVIYTAYIIKQTESNINTSLDIVEYKEYIETSTKTIFNQLLKNKHIDIFMYFANFIQYTDTGGIVDIAFDLEDLQLDDYDAEFYIILSYNDSDIKKAIDNQITENANKIIKKLLTYLHSNRNRV